MDNEHGLVEPDVGSICDSEGSSDFFSDPGEPPEFFELEVAPSSMVVNIRAAPRGEPATFGLVKAELERMGVTAEIDMEALHAFLAGFGADKGIVLVRGIPVDNGHNGDVKLIKPDNLWEGEELDELAPVDHKQRTPFWCAKMGQPLAVVLPPRAGSPGVSVFGRKIEPQPGRVATLVLGDNVGFSDEDPTLVIAKTAGQVRVVRDVISLEPILKIPRDVDYSTGNIDVHADVYVPGDITEGFVVTTKGRLEVGGNIAKARFVRAGELVVRGGILGGEQSAVQCRRDLEARFVENANIRCGGNMVVTQGVVASNVDVGGDLDLPEPAKIAGGHVTAVGNIRASTIGAPSETRTEVEAGRDRAKSQALEANARANQALRKKASKVRAQMSGAENDATRAEAIECFDRLVEKTQNRMLDLHAELSNTAGDRALSRVSATQMLYPGVIIGISDATTNVHSQKGPTQFYLDASTGEVKSAPLEPSE